MQITSLGNVALLMFSWMPYYIFVADTAVLLLMVELKPCQSETERISLVIFLRIIGIDIPKQGPQQV